MTSNLTGTVSVGVTLVGYVGAPAQLTGSLQIPSAVGEEDYEGEYEVTPIMDHNIVLEKEGKLMQNDVTVKSIPHYEMENESGGTTVYIAMEVE